MEVPDSWGKFTLLVESKVNHFAPLKLDLSRESGEIYKMPYWKMSEMSVCGYIMMFSGSNTLSKLSAKNDEYHLERRVRMKEQPNPMLNQTWETEDINKTLSDEIAIPLTSDGSFCFKCAPGRWDIWFDLSPDEQDRGVVINQDNLKVYVLNEGIDNLVFQEVNL